MAKVIEQTMQYERSTKGSHLYSAPFGDTAKIRNQYVPKREVNDGGMPPKTITVRIELGEEVVDQIKM